MLSEASFEVASCAEDVETISRIRLRARRFFMPKILVVWAEIMPKVKLG